MTSYVTTSLTLTLMLVAMLQDGVAQQQQVIPIYDVIEESPSGTVIADLVADLRLGDVVSMARLNATLRLDLLPNLYSDYFEVTSDQGLLLVRRPLDRDSLCRVTLLCRLSLDVAIVHPIALFRVYRLTLSVLDLNDNEPSFDTPGLVLDVLESVPVGTFFVIAGADDPDSGPHSIQSYTFLSDTTAIRLETDPLSVMTSPNDVTAELRLVVAERLDREQSAVYRGRVVAIDGGDPPRSGYLDVTINVLDSNDNRPVFERSSYSVSLREDVAVGSQLLQVHAEDADEGLNARVEYRLVTPRQGGAAQERKFDVDALSGRLTLIAPLDYETEHSHSLTVAANDLGPGSMTSYVKATIIVVDVNDNAPSVRVTALDPVAENQSAGQFVAQLAVEDRDAGINALVDCHAEPSADFRLVPLHHMIYKVVTNVTFDREQRSEHHVTITCRDAGEPRSLEGHAVIVVNVGDENDETPQFDLDLYETTVEENVPIGTSLITAYAFDRDLGLNAEILYSLEDYNMDPKLRNNPAIEDHSVDPTLIDNPKISQGISVPGFSVLDILHINNHTGVISTRGVIDHENLTLVEFKVVARDRGQQAKSAWVRGRVKVVDLNDEAPEFSQESFTFGISENEPGGTEVGHVTAVDRDSSPYDTFRFSILEDAPSSSLSYPLHIDPLTGRLTSTRPLDREQSPLLQISVVATDLTHPHHSTRTRVTVHVADRNDNAPRIDYPAPEDFPIQIFAGAPAGAAVTRVIAWDADAGENALLEFSIAKGNEDGLFGIDPRTGTISITRGRIFRPMDDGESHRLAVLVRDAGIPEKSAMVIIEVVVNGSVEVVDFSADGDNAEYDVGFFGVGNSPTRVRIHHFVVIALACLSLVLVIVLVAAILCVRCRQSRRKDARRLGNASECVTSCGPEVTSEMEEGCAVQRQLSPSPRGRLNNGTLDGGRGSNNEGGNGGVNDAYASLSGRPKKSVQFDMGRGVRQDLRSTYVTFQGHPMGELHSNADPTLDEIEVQRLIEILRLQDPRESMDCSSLYYMDGTQSPLDEQLSDQRSSGEVEYSSGFSSGNTVRQDGSAGGRCAGAGGSDAGEGGRDAGAGERRCHGDWMKKNNTDIGDPLRAS